MPKNLSADSHELRPITGLRGVAALLVVFAHFAQPWKQLIPALRNVPLFSTGVGTIGVDLFFIMSGFILSYVYRYESVVFDRKFLGKFFWFRFARLYPNHLAMLLVLIAMVFAAHVAHVRLTGVYPIADLPAQLTMTHAWPFVPHASPHVPWNFPSWSISSEWFAYLFVFPLSMTLLRYRLSLWTYLFLIVAAVVTAMLGSRSLYPIFPNLSGLVQVSFEFLAGSLAFGLILYHAEFTSRTQRLTSLVGCVLIGLVLLCPINFFICSMGIVLAFPFLLIGITTEASIAAQWLAWQPVLWLGRISYAIYMSHGVFEKVTKIVLPWSYLEQSNICLRLFVILGSLASIIGTAALLYHLVEVPGRNFLRIHRPSWTQEERVSSEGFQTGN